MNEDWTGVSETFTPEGEKKITVIEENSTFTKDQYKLLKKYTGQPFLKEGRYSIPVAITDYEKALFENNVTNTELETEEALQDIYNLFDEYFIYPENLLNL